MQKSETNQEKVVMLLSVFIILFFILMVYGFVTNNPFYFVTGALGFGLGYFVRILWNK